MAYQTFGIDHQHDGEVRQAYRNVFSTKDGQFVLAHILSELSYFDTAIEGERAQGRQDYARRLLWVMGIHDSRNVLPLVQKLLELPVYAEEEQE